MKTHNKIISVILIIGLLVGSAMAHPVEAKTVEMKTKTSNSELKVTLLNEMLDYQLKEVAFKIKNKTANKIKVTKISVQYKSNKGWMALKKQNNSVSKRKKVIDARKTVYDSVNLHADYVIPKDGLKGGKYAIYIKYKYKDKFYFIRKIFSVKGKNDSEKENKTLVAPEATFLPETTTEQETIVEPETTNSSQPTEPTDPENMNKPMHPPNNNSSASSVIEGNKPQSTVSKTNIKIKIANTDFSVEKNGKASLLIFSEADYKKATKTQICISIRRKAKGKWKLYKNYKVIKKSNIAFVSKQIQIRKRGTYRMDVRIIFYDKDKKRKQYKKKSKIQVY